MIAANKDPRVAEYEAWHKASSNLYNRFTETLYDFRKAKKLQQPEPLPPTSINRFKLEGTVVSTTAIFIKESGKYVVQFWTYEGKLPYYLKYIASTQDAEERIASDSVADMLVLSDTDIDKLICKFQAVLTAVLPIASCVV